MKIAPIQRALARRSERASRRASCTPGQHYDAALSQVFFDELRDRSARHHARGRLGQPRAADRRGHGRLRAGAARAGRPTWSWSSATSTRRWPARWWRPRWASPSRTSRPACAASTAACPRRSTASSPTRSPICCSPPRPRRSTNLRREGIAGRADPLRRQRDDRHAAGAPRRVRAALDGCRPATASASGEYAVLTLHRPSNVDEPQGFERLIERDLAHCRGRAGGLPGAPAHPPAVARSPRASALVAASRLRLLEPLGYLEFLGLMDERAAVLTDSGGAQEETTALGVPCLTLRENTERPVTVTHGTNRIVGSDPERIVAAWRDIHGAPRPAGRPPLWDGGAARRIVDVGRRAQLKPGGSVHPDAVTPMMTTRTAFVSGCWWTRCVCPPGCGRSSRDIEASAYCAHRARAQEACRRAPPAPLARRHLATAVAPRLISPIGDATPASSAPRMTPLPSLTPRPCCSTPSLLPVRVRETPLQRLPLGRRRRARPGGAASTSCCASASAPSRGRILEAATSRRVVVPPRRQSRQPRRAGRLLGSHERPADDRIGASGPQ